MAQFYNLLMTETIIEETNRSYIIKPVHRPVVSTRQTPLKMSDHGDMKHEEVYLTTEKELVEVSNFIEDVGKKLAILKPRQRPKQADESLNFEEQILEAAKSITAAVGTLVKAATLAQKELVTGNVTTTRNGCNDLKWSENLITAARHTGKATGALCEAANDAVEGIPCEEKLVSAARAVADSTGELLGGCVVTDPNSKAQKGLQSAGEAVRRAAGALVDAATGSSIFLKVEEDKFEDIMSLNDQKMKEEIEMQEDILRLEKELKKAQARLHHIREINRQRTAEEELSDNEV